MWTPSSPSVDQPVVVVVLPVPKVELERMFPVFNSVPKSALKANSLGVEFTLFPWSE